MSLFLNTLAIFVVKQRILHDLAMSKQDKLTQFLESSTHVEDGCTKPFFMVLFCSTSLGFLPFFRDLMSEVLEGKRAFWLCTLDVT
jgi:hypothetical protein